MMVKFLLLATVAQAVAVHWTANTAVDEAFARFDNTQLPVVVVRGMFSSGTGWLRNLLSINCGKDVQFLDPANKGIDNLRVESVDADGLYGWKHSYFNSHEQARFASRPNHFMTVLSRDAFTWAHSTNKMHALVKSAPTLAQFVSQYAFEDLPSNSYLAQFYANAAMENRNDLGPHLNGRNVFEVRNKVYANLLSQNQTSRHKIYFLQYEALRAAPATTLLDMLGKFSLTCRKLSPSTFKNQEFRVKMKNVSFGVKVADSDPKQEVCKVLHAQVGLYESILTMLDLEFEANVLGYTYPSTLEAYCSSVMPLEEPITITPIIPQLPLHQALPLQQPQLPQRQALQQPQLPQRQPLQQPQRQPLQQPQLPLRQPLQQPHVLPLLPYDYEFQNRCIIALSILLVGVVLVQLYVLGAMRHKTRVYKCNQRHISSMQCDIGTKLLDNEDGEGSLA